MFVDRGRKSKRAADARQTERERDREHLWVRERKQSESLKVWEGGIVVVSVSGDRPGPRMCPWLLLCVSALPGWHRWHRHFPAASVQSWATAVLPGANLHIHTATHTISLSLPSPGRATGCMLAWAHRDCQDQMTPAGLLKLCGCFVIKLCCSWYVLSRDVTPPGRVIHPSIIHQWINNWVIGLVTVGSIC